MRKLAIIAALAALVVSPSAVFAQESLLPSTAWGFAPMVSAWHFAKPLATAAGGIQDVAQAAVPFQIRAVVGGRWSFDLTGAFADFCERQALTGDISVQQAALFL